MKSTTNLAPIGLLALALLATPPAAEGQQPGKIARIGWLSPGTAAPAGAPEPTRDGFLRGLRDHGYVESENIIVERRYGEYRPERLPALAAELAALRVEAIVVVGPFAVAPPRRRPGLCPS